MTYTMWPVGDSIFKMQCLGHTSSGKRCKRRHWITTYEAPDGWQCFQHVGQDEAFETGSR